MARPKKVTIPPSYVKRHAKHRAKKSPAQLQREIDAVLARPDPASRIGAQPRVAYRIRLTPSELRAVNMARGRYSWPDMLAAHALEDGLVAFSESEMEDWTDDVDVDGEPFSLASGGLASKLQAFYNSKI